MQSGLKIYEIDESYIDTLSEHAPFLLHNSKKNQTHSRKYIGIVLRINSVNYFAPLSSFKPKHNKMKEGMELVKIGNYAVINLNCMFPAPEATCQYVDFSQEKDPKYKVLLMNEYRIIKSKSEKIRKNADLIYRYNNKYGNDTELAKRCNDFAALEQIASTYSKS